MSAERVTEHGSVKVPEFKTVIIHFSEQDRELIDELKEKYEVRTQAAVLREVVSRVRNRTGEKLVNTPSTLRKEIILASEAAAEQMPFAEGTGTSVQLPVSMVDYLESAAKALNVGDRSKLLRAAIRVAANGKV